MRDTGCSARLTHTRTRLSLRWGDGRAKNRNMIQKYYQHRFALIFSLLLLLSPILAPAQTNNPRPLTSQELVRLVYQLPAHPEKRDEIAEAIRTRGLGFPLTDGLRSLVATKSGNDAL